MSILRILLGLAIGSSGVFQIANCPFGGCAAVLLGGILVLEAINQFFGDESSPPR